MALFYNNNNYFFLQASFLLYIKCFLFYKDETHRLRELHSLNRVGDSESIDVCIRSSFDLLPPGFQRRFVALSFFRSSFDKQAAEAVLDGDVNALEDQYNLHRTQSNHISSRAMSPSSIADQPIMSSLSSVHQDTDSLTIQNSSRLLSNPEDDYSLLSPGTSTPRNPPKLTYSISCDILRELAEASLVEFDQERHRYRLHEFLRLFATNEAERALKSDDNNEKLKLALPLNIKHEYDVSNLHREYSQVESEGNSEESEEKSGEENGDADDEQDSDEKRQDCSSFQDYDSTDELSERMTRFDWKNDYAIDKDIAMQSSLRLYLFTCAKRYVLYYRDVLYQASEVFLSGGTLHGFDNDRANIEAAIRLAWDMARYHCSSSILVDVERLIRSYAAKSNRGRVISHDLVSEMETTSVDSSVYISDQYFEESDGCVEKKGGLLHQDSHVESGNGLDLTLPHLHDEVANTPTISSPENIRLSSTDSSNSSSALTNVLLRDQFNKRQQERTESKLEKRKARERDREETGVIKPPLQRLKSASTKSVASSRIDLLWDDNDGDEATYWARLYCSICVAGRHILRTRMEPHVRLTVFGKCLAFATSWRIHHGGEIPLPSFASLFTGSGGVVTEDIVQSSTEAIEAARYEEELCRSAKWALSPHEALLLVEMGTIMSDISRFEESKTMYKQSITLQVDILHRRDHCGVAEAQTMLAVLFNFLQINQDTAEKMLQQSLAIRTRVFGPKHPIVATSLNNIANMKRQEHRKWEEVESIYKECLAIREAALGETNPQVAQTYNNLGLLYSHMHKFDLAEEMYMKSLEIRRECLGDKCIEVASSLNNLGNLKKYQKKFEEAAKLIKDSLDIRLNYYREMNDTVAQSYLNLSSVYEEMGRFDDAEDALKKCAAQREEVCPNADQLIKTLHKLALLLFKQRKYTEAEQAIAKRNTAISNAPPDSKKRLERRYLSKGSFSTRIYIKCGIEESFGFRGRFFGAKHVHLNKIQQQSNTSIEFNRVSKKNAENQDKATSHSIPHSSSFHSIGSTTDFDSCSVVSFDSHLDSVSVNTGKDTSESPKLIPPSLRTSHESLSQEGVIYSNLRNVSPNILDTTYFIFEPFVPVTNDILDPELNAHVVHGSPHDNHAHNKNAENDCHSSYIPSIKPSIDSKTDKKEDSLNTETENCPKVQNKQGSVERWMIGIRSDSADSLMLGKRLCLNHLNNLRERYNKWVIDGKQVRQDRDKRNPNTFDGINSQKKSQYDRRSSKDSKRSILDKKPQTTSINPITDEHTMDKFHISPKLSPQALAIETEQQDVHSSLRPGPKEKSRFFSKDGCNSKQSTRTHSFQGAREIQEQSNICTNSSGLLDNLAEMSEQETCTKMNSDNDSDFNGWEQVKRKWKGGYKDKKIKEKESRPKYGSQKNKQGEFI